MNPEDTLARLQLIIGAPAYFYAYDKLTVHNADAEMREECSSTNQIKKTPRVMRDRPGLVWCTYCKWDKLLLVTDADATALSSEWYLQAYDKFSDWLSRGQSNLGECAQMFQLLKPLTTLKVEDPSGWDLRERFHPHLAGLMKDLRPNLMRLSGAFMTNALSANKARFEQYFPAPELDAFAVRVQSELETDRVVSLRGVEPDATFADAMINALRTENPNVYVLGLGLVMLIDEGAHEGKYSMIEQEPLGREDTIIEHYDPETCPTFAECVARSAKL